MPNRGSYREDDRERMRGGRYAERYDRGERGDRDERARGMARDRDWSSQSNRGRVDVCPSCGAEMRESTGYGRGGYDRGAYDRGGYDRGGYDRGGYDDHASQYNAGNRPRGMPDEGWSTWGSDRERGYATRSVRSRDHWDRDEYGGSADEERWRGRDDYYR
jgi:hypothetical protein